MDTYDTADSDEHPLLGRLIKVGLFLLAQGIAVVLVAFVALLVSFGTGWSATTEQAGLRQPGEARSGSLLLKQDGAETIRLRTGVDITMSIRSACPTPQSRPS